MENERLAAEVALLRERVTALEVLAEENDALDARLSELEATLGDLPTEDWRAFLEGRGRGTLPDGLDVDEVTRLRELVLRTRAPRPAMLALAAGLGVVYASPSAHQRLTTLSFQEHPFDSLWRLRVGSHRIVYGLTGMTPKVVTIASRADVYGETVHALKNRRF